MAVRSGITTGSRCAVGVHPESKRRERPLVAPNEYPKRIASDNEAIMAGVYRGLPR